MLEYSSTHPTQLITSHAFLSGAAYAASKIFMPTRCHIYHISANRCNLNVAQGPSLIPLPHLNTRAPSTPLHPYKHINPMLQQLLPSTQHSFHRSSQFRPSNSHSCLNLTLSQQQRQRRLWLLLTLLLAAKISDAVLT